jgi:general secretion pathway protein C
MLSRLGSQAQDRVQRAGALGVCALAALACAVTLSKLVWLALPRSAAGNDPAAAIAAAPAAGAVAAASVAKWHLFGNPQNAIAMADLARSGPNTTLKLNLHGTLAMDDPTAGMAMIADDQGVERAYRVGDEVPGGATLAAVFPDRVTLKHEGANETLELPHPENHAPPQAVPGAPSLTASAPRATPIAPLYTPPNLANGAVDWNKVQQQYNINPEELARQVQVLPVMENGKFSGVRLSAGPNAALFNQLGLRPTDIVTAVNGKALDGLGNAQQLVDSLKNSSRIQVTVQRDGKPATLTVNLK